MILEIDIGVGVYQISLSCLKNPGSGALMGPVIRSQARLRFTRFRSCIGEMVTRSSVTGKIPGDGVPNGLPYGDLRELDTTERLSGERGSHLAKSLTDTGKSDVICFDSRKFLLFRLADEIEVQSVFSPSTLSVSHESRVYSLGLMLSSFPFFLQKV